MITVPATKLSGVSWTFLTIARNTTIEEGKIVPRPINNCNANVTDYLGDADGNPVQMIDNGQQSNVQIDFSEEITRADGSKLSVQDLIESIIAAQIAK